MNKEPSKPETAFDAAKLSSRLTHCFSFTLHTLITTNKVSSLKGLRIAENAYVVNDKCKPVFKVSSFKGEDEQRY